MDNQPASKVVFVLCQIIFFFGALAIKPALAQQPDTAKGHAATNADSVQRTAFHPTNTIILPINRGRSIDVAITGGAGSYNNGTITAFQPTANADFFAQTSELDLTAGLHWGFSNPSTKAVSLGVRLPITESEDGSSGFFGDASLLFIDNGTNTDSTSDAFSTGLRAALAARSGPFECRVAGEIRTFPFGGNTFEGWAGIEAGFVLNLLRENTPEPTPKDSLKAALHYIATSEEMKTLDEAMTSEDIDAWLNRFWQARNITGSHQNEARQEYMRRVQIANEKYGTPREMGVKTDQGRVLLLYGEPDRTEIASIFRVWRGPKIPALGRRKSREGIPSSIFSVCIVAKQRGTWTLRGSRRLSRNLLEYCR